MVERITEDDPRHCGMGQTPVGRGLDLIVLCAPAVSREGVYHDRLCH